MNDACISCGSTVPEGRLTCPNCENSWKWQPDAILQDGTPLYLKTRVSPRNTCLQLFLYDLLNRNSN